MLHMILINHIQTTRCTFLSTTAIFHGNDHSYRNTSQGMPDRNGTFQHDITYGWVMLQWPLPSRHRKCQWITLARDHPAKGSSSGALDYHDTITRNCTQPYPNVTLSTQKQCVQHAEQNLAEACITRLLVS